MGDLRPLRFRIQNFRNIDDSGWIELDHVTALVGRNESGKTALLQALHKFHPSSPLEYRPQREFPRERFQREFTPEKAKTIPVCSVEFAIEGALSDKVSELTGTPSSPPTITYTRYYGGNLMYSLPDVTTAPISSKPVDGALTKLAQAARRIRADGENAAKLEEVRLRLLDWVTKSKDALPSGDLRSEPGRALLKSLLTGVEQFSRPETAGHVETFREAIESLAVEAAQQPLPQQIADLCNLALPVFIYFENYGILDSAVHLSRFIEDAARMPDDSKVRTIAAMFQHVNLSATEIAQLGIDTITAIRARENRAPTPEELAADKERKELRAIRLNAASLDITERFSTWWHQRRHHIVYDADADFFRIWVTDDRRPDVKIEFESRSKGFQWFFSFYLVFLVESDEEHRNAVLLLDEPGLHLHPTAQADLLSFFDKLAEKNQLIYTTHSPFLVDGRRLTRVRAVMETPEGRCRVTTDLGPADRETLVPLQAALGYEMAQTLFHGKRYVLVEGMSDMHYLNGLNYLLLRSRERSGLDADICVTPSIGTKAIGILASIYTGQGSRPLVLLDDDDAGRVRQRDLVKELFKGKEQRVLFLSDVVPACAEMEDVVGEDSIVRVLGETLGKKVALTVADREGATGVVDSLRAWSRRTGKPLPIGWKLDVAWRLVREWGEGETEAPTDLIDRAAALISALNARA